jgi:predicted anti-sigma-YlaC factor YlaD
MNCSHSKQYIILETTDLEFSAHLQECEECSAINGRVNDSMAILDSEVQVPNDLFDKIMEIKKEIHFEKRKPKDVSLLFQFSTVIAAAIILGIILGFHANTQLFISKNAKKNEALIEFKEMHHMNVDRPGLF